MSLRWCLLLSIWERGMHFWITYVKYQKNYILTVLDKKIYSVPWFQTLGRATEAIGTCLGWASGTSTSSSIDGTVACIDILAKFFCIWSAKAQGPTLSTSWVLVDVEVTKAEGVTRFFLFFSSFLRHMEGLNFNGNLQNGKKPDYHCLLLMHWNPCTNISVHN